MSVETLFDHKAEVYNPTASPTVDEFGDTGSAFAAAVVEHCAVVPPKLSLRDYGAGDVPSGRMDGYFRADAAVVRRAVVKLISGPEAPSTWIVDNVAHPRGHHTEVILTPWSGTPTP